MNWAQLWPLGIANTGGAFTVRVRVDDGQGHVVTSAPATLTVVNVAPTVNAGFDQYVNEGDTVILSGSFTDPGVGETYGTDWHIVSDNGQTISDASSTTLSFVPDDNGTYTATFTVTDGNGGVGTGTVQIHVFNADPVVTILGLPARSKINVPVKLSMLVTDPSPVDTAAGFTFGWTVTETKNGSTTNVTSVSGSSFSLTPTDAAVYTVALTATDKDGGVGSASRSITVNGGINAPPHVTITGPASASAYSVGSPVVFTGSFTDPDSPGVHTAVWSFASPGLPAISIPGLVTANGIVSATYTFNNPGVYQVTLSVIDSGGATGRSSTIGSAPAEVAIYDRTAGGIIGAGSFNSPAGAETANAKFSGKAYFAFYAQYPDCGSAPIGLFTFTVDKLCFVSTHLNWLVISGSKAELEGTGVANGHLYSFLLTFIDGKIAAGSDPVRVKIWNPATGSILYANQPGANDWDCVRQTTDALYILACKREGATLRVRFDGLPSEAGRGEVMFESPRTVQAAGGGFTDWFGPFDVHVYRFAKVVAK